MAATVRIRFMIPLYGLYVSNNAGTGVSMTPGRVQGDYCSGTPAARLRIKRTQSTSD